MPTEDDLDRTRQRQLRVTGIKNLLGRIDVRFAEIEIALKALPDQQEQPVLNLLSVADKFGQQFEIRLEWLARLLQKRVTDHG